MASVKHFLDQADAAARARAPELALRWVRLSHLLGSLVPKGSATELLQEVGRLDLLIRAIEDEHDPFLHPLVPMSVTWVAISYEVIRALKQRVPDLEGLEPLCRRLELVRIPLLKFEIAQEGKNQMPPLQLYAYPPKSSDEGCEFYDRNEKTRAYRPIGVLTPEGIGWRVVESATLDTTWVTRRSLADQLLGLSETVSVFHASKAGSASV